MFGAWRYEENGLNDWVERKFGARTARILRPVAVVLMDIAAAPVELAQRLFYRPNTRRDQLVVEDLRAKSKNQLKQSYLEDLTQQFYADKHSGLKFDPRRTYENLAACTSGTFKAIDPDMAHTVETASNLVVAQDSHFAPNSMSIAPRMSDSQTITGQHRSLLVRPLKGEFAETAFGATKSGTFFPLAGFHKWQHETSPRLADSVQEKRSSQTGSYSSLQPDLNPHGLKQFITDSET